jgi:hypothetical protein
MTIKRDSTETRELRGWFGTAQDMMAIVRIVEEMYADERQVDAAKVSHENGREWEIENHRRNWQPDVRVYEAGGVKVSGPLDQILSDTPPDRIHTVIYEYPSWRITGSQVELRFRQRLGLEITVRGSEPVRVRSMISVVYDRASQKCPRWIFLLSGTGVLWLYLGVLAAFFGLGLGVLRHFDLRPALQVSLFWRA